MNLKDFLLEWLTLRWRINHRNWVSIKRTENSHLKTSQQGCIIITWPWKATALHEWVYTLLQPALISESFMIQIKKPWKDSRLCGCAVTFQKSDLKNRTPEDCSRFCISWPQKGQIRKQAQNGNSFKFKVKQATYNVKVRVHDSMGSCTFAKCSIDYWMAWLFRFRLHIMFCIFGCACQFSWAQYSFLTGW